MALDKLCRDTVIAVDAAGSTGRVLPSTLPKADGLICLNSTYRFSKQMTAGDLDASHGSRAHGAQLADYFHAILPRRDLCDVVMVRAVASVSHGLIQEGTVVR